MIDPSARMLTSAIKKQISADWQKHFPGFAIYKPMWLLRRAGPIVLGIILERDRSNDNYKPIFHIHNLTMAFETVALTLSNQLKSKAGGPDWVTVRSHNDSYSDTIQRFRKQCFLPCDGPVNFKEVINGFKETSKRNAFETLSQNDFADMALICGWAGQKRQGKKYLKRSLSMMEHSAPWIDKEYGSVQNWYKLMEERIENPEILKEIVSSEIIRHKLSKIPVSNFEV